MQTKIHPFVHLHVHSYYSTLDGLSTVYDLVDTARNDGQRGLALTDHGNMFGVKQFFNYVNKINAPILSKLKELKTELDKIEDQSTKTAKQKEIAEEEQKLFKPIFGCECYCAKRGRLCKDNFKVDRSGYHLIVLAKNKIGYHNLIKMVSLSYTEGKYQKPRIDKELLERYHEGLIISSACLGGEIPQLIAAGEIEKAEESIEWFKSIFGSDYYLELQRHETSDPAAERGTYPRQVKVNEVLVQLARKHGVKLIATNDVHFAKKENADAHDCLVCMSMGKTYDDPNRLRYTKQEYLKTQAEMSEIFADIPEALTNTQEILDKVEFYSIDHKPLMPDFPLPEGFSNADEYLEYLTYTGAKERYGDPLSEEVTKRLEFELQTIKSMGFPGYFLIVQDFINAARDMGVYVGPGRGSAAGSAVAYCLKITNIDPISYDLLFERFLSLERISLPDIDIDFDDDGRLDIIKWVTDKYGYDSVAHIITYNTMASKSSIKNVARVNKVDLSQSERLAKMVPARIPDVKKVNLPTCLKLVPEFSQVYNSNNGVLKNVIDFAIQLEGTINSIGVHPCGIIIGQKPIAETVPVATSIDKNSNEEIVITQYDGKLIEETGLIKMDFLGLKTLSILKETLNNIKKRHHIDIDLNEIPLDDELTYKLFCEGNTLAVFQFESAGMQKYMKELQPSRFEDLIAMNALYRPGPMEYIPSFIRRKHGQEQIDYDLPCMEKYLNSTYGITVYQEQVMLLSREIANFTRGESDSLRKAMGKKLYDKMEALKDKYLSGGIANGYKKDILEKIWSDWEKFASYAFNKSHATCYSLLAYQTAYFKAHYPAEFMAGNLSRNLNNAPEIIKCIDECKNMGINVLCPDINESENMFFVNNDGDVLYGLGAIKGIPRASVNAIITEREANGKYQNIFDFFERVNLQQVTKKALESLVLSGAFDSFETFTREDLMSEDGENEPFILRLQKYGIQYQQEQNNKQLSLFGDSFNTMSKPQLSKKANLWPKIERLRREKEYLGVYVSANPLDKYAILLKYICPIGVTEITDLSEYIGQELSFGGMVTGYREAYTKKGNRCGFIKIQDYNGEGELALFGEDFTKYRNFGTEGMFIFVNMRVEADWYNNTKARKQIVDIKQLEDVQAKGKYKLDIFLNVGNIDFNFVSTFLSYLKSMEKQNSINSTKSSLNVYLADSVKNVKIQLMPKTEEIQLSTKFLDFLNECEDIDFSLKIS